MNPCSACARGYKAEQCSYSPDGRVEFRDAPGPGNGHPAPATQPDLPGHGPGGQTSEVAALTERVGQLEKTALGRAGPAAAGGHITGGEPGTAARNAAAGRQGLAEQGQVPRPGALDERRRHGECLPASEPTRASRGPQLPVCQIPRLIGIVKGMELEKTDHYDVFMACKGVGPHDQSPAGAGPSWPSTSAATCLAGRRPTSS